MPSLKNLIDHLDAVKVQPAAFAANAAKGPIRPIFSVNYGDLASSKVVPAALSDLLKKLATSALPFDAGKPESRNDETMGAMRQIHSNERPSWLPNLSGAAATFVDNYNKVVGNAAAMESGTVKPGSTQMKNLKKGYDEALGKMTIWSIACNEYITKNKKQTNDNGGSNDATGYVEYTAGTLGLYDPEPELRSRIVMDYINNRYYFSPAHYHSWEFKGETIKFISGNSAELTGAHPSAFYQIVNIC